MATRGCSERERTGICATMQNSAIVIKHDTDTEFHSRAFDWRWEDVEFCVITYSSREIIGGTRIFEVRGSEGARPRAWGQKKIVVIGLSTEEN